MKMTFGNFALDFSKKTHVMGILNVTPDSFSDGGLHFDAQKALDRATAMIEDGADIIDIGGESTRPGSDPVTLDEELRRTIPVIEALAKKISVPISIDTYKAAVAERALEAGASMINDISGLGFDPEMPKIAARHGVPVVLMHIKGTPKDMQTDTKYRALIPDIVEYLRKRIGIALEAGVAEDMIIVDPGIGFGKNFDQNLQLINNLDKLSALGKPILVGPSRKAFIGKILGDVGPEKRLEGTIAAVAACIMKGACIVRVHDVAEISKAVKIADAIRREKI